MRVEKQDEYESFLGSKIPKEVDIHPPNDVNSRGRSKRIKKSKETKEKKAGSKGKGNRTCRKYKQQGDHDACNCPNNVVGWYFNWTMYYCAAPAMECFLKTLLVNCNVLACQIWDVNLLLFFIPVRLYLQFDHLAEAIVHNVYAQYNSLFSILWLHWTGIKFLHETELNCISQCILTEQHTHRIKNSLTNFRRTTIWFPIIPTTTDSSS